MAVITGIAILSSQSEQKNDRILFHQAKENKLDKNKNNTKLNVTKTLRRLTEAL